MKDNEALKNFEFIFWFRMFDADTFICIYLYDGCEIGEELKDSRGAIRGKKVA